MANKNRFLLLTLILMAFAIRLTRLGTQSLWYDEGVTWQLARSPSPADLIRWTAADIQPPFYYLLIELTSRAFGNSEYALRFPSVIFNLLTIPLLYHLGKGNKMPALILTISPIMVYYSQEARMYTLLVLEASLMSYLLRRIIRGPSAMCGYIMVATAALYTHYFAAFLLIAHFLTMWLILWQRNWPKILLKQIGQMFGGIAILFAPWLPILLSRLGDDPSYWSGTLKLNEVIPKIFINFTVGETVFEQTAFGLALVYLGFLMFDFGYQISNHQLKKFIMRNALFIIELFVPLTLILALSYHSPKFNPRYTLLAWPAFALLIGGRRQSYWLISYLLPIFMVATSAFSLHNWFTDPRFGKDDFRALAQFVKERRAIDETILLSSGHFFPVWAYYYGWTGWTALPRMERLDIKRVTDLTIATEMSQALADKGGVWLVNWQDEVIDPNGVIPFWLDLIGQRPKDAGDFWGVRLEHWRLKQPELLNKSPIQQPTQFNFNNLVNLVGMTQLSDSELVLFWQARQSLPDNFIVTLDLTDKDNFIWHDERLSGQLGSFFYPPSRWPMGQTIITRHHLPWRVGTPPDLYIAAITVGQLFDGSYQSINILDEQGRPERPTALLNQVNLTHLIEPPHKKSTATPPIVNLAHLLSLQKSTLSSPKIEPGDRLNLALLWQIGQPNEAEISFTFELVDAQRQIFSPDLSLQSNHQFNLSRWRQNDLVLNQYQLDIPPLAATGAAILQLHFNSPTDTTFPFDKLEILPTKRNFTPPTTLDIPLNANFSGQATLLGLDCQANCTAVAGGTMTMTFYWRSEMPMQTNYTIFAHLLDGNEMVIIAADHAPPKATHGWVKGEIITDALTLTIPVGLSPGRYSFEIGLYNANSPTFPRLPLVNGETRLILPQPILIP